MILSHLLRALELIIIREPQQVLQYRWMSLQNDLTSFSERTGSFEPNHILSNPKRMERSISCSKRRWPQPQGSLSEGLAFLPTASDFFTRLNNVDASNPVFDGETARTVGRFNSKLYNKMKVGNCLLVKHGCHAAYYIYQFSSIAICNYYIRIRYANIKVVFFLNTIIIKHESEG